MYFQWKNLVFDEYRLPLPGQSEADAENQAMALARERIEATGPIKVTHWASIFISESKDGLAFTPVDKVRYKLVPGRMPEDAFWYCFFVLIRKEISHRVAESFM